MRESKPTWRLPRRRRSCPRAEADGRLLEKNGGAPRCPSDVAPLNIWDGSVPELLQSYRLSAKEVSAPLLGENARDAAFFVFGLLWRDASLRREFPRPITDPSASFCDWLTGAGGHGLGLSADARQTIRSLFERRFGELVYDVYLNNSELQSTYRIGLLPAGQAHFLGWLLTHGRRDHGITSGEVLWFLLRSAEDLERGVTLTYRLRPDWQERFPTGLSCGGWPRFLQWLESAYGQWLDISQLQAAAMPNGVNGRPTISSNRRWWRGHNPADLDGVNIISHFCQPSGIQQAAVWTKTALESVGLHTSCRDLPAPRPTIATNRSEWLGLEQFPVTILTHAATPHFETTYQRAGLFRRQEVYRIAYWAWELEQVPPAWISAAALVDEIWSPTPFVANAMRSVMPVRVTDMLPGLHVEPRTVMPRERFGLSDRDCVFLFMFDFYSQVHRKNPGGVIHAFRRAFARTDTARLLIKVTGGDAHPDDLERLGKMCRTENVMLVHELTSRDRAYGLIDMCDCYVSLHRSEGFGLPLAEAMLLGKPVIATGYSGNLAFMNRENSMLVDYELVEITEDRPIYTRGNRWAEPSIEQAAEYMRHVYEHREQAAAKAARVQPQIAELLSLKSAGKRMRQRLEQIMRERRA